MTDWNAALLGALRNETTPPPLASRNLAILHTAIYDAVNTVAATHTPYFTNPSGFAGASIEAAALAAGYHISKTLYPSQAGSFEQIYNNALQELGGGPPVTSGLSLGETVANNILNWRVADGAGTQVTYIPGTEPGDWRRTPPFFRPPESPNWRNVTPFALESGSQFRPPGPPGLTSEEYALEYNMVKELGAANSATRTAEQTEIARFWSDFSYTVTPPGHWNQIAEIVSGSEGLSIEQNARLFAMLNVALADAAIAGWDAKYEFNFWRPVTAIQQGDRDNNPLTVADPNWQSLLNAPSFPEYISGHSAFSSAAATILSLVFGRDEYTFTIGSDELPGVTRTYHSFSETADEIGMSRIYGGIHFLSGDLDGLALGEQIGHYVEGHYFQAVPEPGPAILFSVMGGALWLLRTRGQRKRGG